MPQRRAHRIKGVYQLMSRVGRAGDFGENQRFMKVAVEADTRKILGAAILGQCGDEAVHGIVDIMNAELPYMAIQRSVYIHPAVSELIPTVLGSLHPVEQVIRNIPSSNPSLYAGS